MAICYESERAITGQEICSEGGATVSGRNVSLFFFVELSVVVAKEKGGGSEGRA